MARHSCLGVRDEESGRVIEACAHANWIVNLEEIPANAANDRSALEGGLLSNWRTIVKVSAIDCVMYEALAA